MATIQIEDIRPVRSNASGNDVGGVYPIRAISTDRRSLRSTDHEYQHHKEDEDSGLRRDGDFKKKQVCVFGLRMVLFLLDLILARVSWKLLDEKLSHCSLTPFYLISSICSCWEV